MKMHLMAIRFATLLGFSLLFISPGPAFAQTSVVYHIDDAQLQGLKGLRNIRNHLDVAPDTKITVVTHANGVDILMDGGKDQRNNVEYGPLVGALKSRGVRFEVCEITLKNRNLKKEQFTLDADFTPSGVARIADLQFKNRFAYIRP
jgi:intracellular sulfur oxidation DsrE/DsrF family protein